MTAKSSIDWAKVDAAADRIVLGYEIADAMSDYADESPEQYLSAVTVAHVATAFALLNVGITEKQALTEFGKTFRAVRKHRKRLGGDDVLLREVLTEMQLDQRK